MYREEEVSLFSFVIVGSLADQTLSEAFGRYGMMRMPSRMSCGRKFRIPPTGKAQINIATCPPAALYLMHRLLSSHSRCGFACSPKQAISRGKLDRVNVRPCPRSSYDSVLVKSNCCSRSTRRARQRTEHCERPN